MMNRKNLGTPVNYSNRRSTLRFAVSACGCDAKTGMAALFQWQRARSFKQVE